MANARRATGTGAKRGKSIPKSNNRYSSQGKRQDETMGAFYNDTIDSLRKGLTSTSVLSDVLSHDSVSNADIDYLTSGSDGKEVLINASSLGHALGARVGREDYQHGSNEAEVINAELERMRTDAINKKPKTRLQSFVLNSEDKRRIRKQYDGIVFEALAEALPKISGGDKRNVNTGTALISAALLVAVGSLGMVSTFSRKHQDLLEARIDGIKRMNSCSRAWDIKIAALGHMQQAFRDGIITARYPDEIAKSDENEKVQEMAPNAEGVVQKMEMSEGDPEAETQEGAQDSADVWALRKKERLPFSERHKKQAEDDKQASADIPQTNKVIDDYLTKKLEEVKTAKENAKGGQVLIDIYANGVPCEVASNLTAEAKEILFDNQYDQQQLNIVRIDFTSLYNMFCNEESAGYKHLEEKCQNTLGFSIKNLSESQIVEMALATVSPKVIAEDSLTLVKNALKEIDENAELTSKEGAACMADAIETIDNQVLANYVKGVYGAQGSGDASKGINSVGSALAVGFKSVAATDAFWLRNEGENSDEVKKDVEMNRRAMSRLVAYSDFYRNKKCVSCYFDPTIGVGYEAKVVQEDGKATYVVTESMQGFMPRIGNVALVEYENKKADVDEAQAEEEVVEDVPEESEEDSEPVYNCIGLVNAFRAENGLSLGDSSDFTICDESMALESFVEETLKAIDSAAENHRVCDIVKAISFLAEGDDGGYVLSDSAYDRQMMFAPGYDIATRVAHITDMYRCLGDDLALKPDANSEQTFADMFTDIATQRMLDVLSFSKSGEENFSLDEMFEGLSAKTENWITSVRQGIVHSQFTRSSEEVRSCAKLFKENGEITQLLNQIESGKYDPSVFSQESGFQDFVVTLELLKSAHVKIDDQACACKVAQLAQGWLNQCFSKDRLNTLGQVAFDSNALNEGDFKNTSACAKAIQSVISRSGVKAVSEEVDVRPFLADSPLDYLRTVGVNLRTANILPIEYKSVQQAHEEAVSAAQGNKVERVVEPVDVLAKEDTLPPLREASMPTPTRNKDFQLSM